MAPNNETLYTTAEIEMATGMTRGTITSRAFRLGIERTGKGYTSQQVLQILTMPLQLHRKSEEVAMELRERLQQMIIENNIPMWVVQKENGKWTMEYRK